MNKRQTKIYKSLLAGAIGDSLGADIEFKRGAMIADNRELAMSKGYGVKGGITDDTQMTLFTAEGIALSNRTEAKSILEEVGDALYRWYGTQHAKVGEFGLAADVRMVDTRAPGNSCLTSLSGYMKGKPAVHSLGCGTIMRVAPVGLAFDDLSVIWEIAIETSRITHDHVEGYLPAAVWAIMIREASNGKTLSEIVKEEVYAPFATEEDKIVGTRVVEQIRKIAKATPAKRNRKTLESYGSAFHAESALYIAFAACYWGHDLDSSYMLAVNHSGDSDTTGAIAGNMLGLIYPEEVLTSKWAKQVECKDLIREVALNL